jgi:peptidoglycan/xylan/chitin deacetylase (PgdA/CDA1 family)
VRKDALLLHCLAVLAAGCASTPSTKAGSGPLMAVTVDDLPVHSALPPGETRIGIARSVIAALEAENVPAVGFINGAGVEREPSLIQVLEEWAAAGLPLGNHGWSHADLKQVTVDQYRGEIVRNEPLLERLSPDGKWRWFRYPNLSEGETPQKRQAIRAILAERGYRIAAVTMNFDDWAFNNAYGRCAARRDRKTMARLERRFLQAARSEALAARRMARRLTGRDIPYVLLLHVGTMDAKLMPDLLALYRRLGYAFVPLEEAQADPFYAADNDPRLAPQPSGLAERVEARRLVPAGKTRIAELDGICR